MFSPHRFIAVAKKEFLELKRNRLFFMMTILAPVILYFLFAYGFSLDAKNIPIGILDLDKTVISRGLIDAFQSAGDLFVIKKVAEKQSALDKDIDLNRIRAIVVIPENFSRDLKKPVPVTLQVLIDGVNPTYANIVGSYMEAVIVSFQNRVLGEYFLKRYMKTGRNEQAIDLRVSAWYNSAFRSEDFIVPGIVAIVMMFFPPLVATISLSKEKETGSILNMYCSSVTRSEYLLGKMVPYIIIFYLNSLLFIWLSTLIFKVPMRGSILILAIASLFYVASAVALGLLIAVLVSTQVAAILITSILTLTPSFLYSGFMVPISNLGQEGKYMAYMLPTTFYIDVARKIMVKGAAFIHIKFDVFMVAVFAVGLFAVCIKLFKKRLK